VRWRGTTEGAPSCQRRDWPTGSAPSGNTAQYLPHNAIATGLCALALLIEGRTLAPLFGAPATVLWAVGALFVPFAAGLLLASIRPLRAGVAALIGALDAGYVLLSVASARRLRTAAV
jgi:hypothetical protein